MNFIFSIIGNTISALALLWAVYSFVLKKREDSAQKDRNDFNRTFSTTKEILEVQLKDMKEKIKEQEREFSLLKLAVVKHNEKILAQSQIIEDSSKRVEKILDRHETRFESLGKVIIK